MAKSKAEKVTTIREEVSPEELSVEDRRSDEEQQEIEQFMDEVGAAGKTVKLYKRDPMTGKLAYCPGGVIPREAFNEELVFSRWGAGMFQARLRDEHNRPLGSKMFQIVDLKDGAPKPDAAAKSSELDPFAKMLVESQEKRADEFKTLLLAMLARNNDAPKGGGILETITVLSQLGLIGKNESVNPREIVKDLHEAWADGRAVGAEQGDGGRRGGGFADVVHDVAPLVQEGFALLKNAQTPPQARPPQRALPGPAGKPPEPVAGQPAAPAAPVVDVATLPPWLQGVYRYLGLLVGMANADMDPEATADQILNKLPPEAEEALARDVAVEGWEAKTLGLLPPQLSQAHEGWTRAVLTAIKTALTTPPDEPEPAP